MLAKKDNKQISTIFSNSLFMLTLLLLLGIFLSTALVSLSEVLIVSICTILVITNSTARQQIISLFQLSPVKVGLLLLALIFIFTFISKNTYSEALEHASKYRELLLFPLLIFILNNKTWKRIIYYSFLVGMVLVLIHSYLQFFGLVENSSSLDEQNTSIIGRIAGAIMLAFTCFAFLEETLRYKNRYKFWLGLILFLLSSFALLYYFNGRTGILIYFALMVLYGFRFLGIKSIFVTSLLIILILFTLYSTSPSVKHRIDDTYQQIEDLINTDISPDDPTRTGIYFGTKVLLEKHDLTQLIIGTGTASLAYEAKHNGYQFSNPHSEYILLLFEDGILGITLFTLFLVGIWKQSKLLPESEKWLLRNLVLTFAIGSITNSLLLDNREAHFFILLAASFLPLYRKPNN